MVARALGQFQAEMPSRRPASDSNAAETQNIRSLLPEAGVTLGSFSKGLRMNQQTSLLCCSLDLSMKHQNMLQVSKSKKENRVGKSIASIFRC